MNSEFHPPFDAYKGDESYLFVSYAHDDKSIVYPIIKDFNKKKTRIWYDEGIPASSNWIEQIATKIINCTYFLVFITPRALESEHVRNEINYALRKKKRMFIIYLEDTELPVEIDFQIGSIQALFKHKMTDEALWRKLENEIPDVISGPKQDFSISPAEVPNDVRIPTDQFKVQSGEETYKAAVSFPSSSSKAEKIIDEFQIKLETSSSKAKKIIDEFHDKIKKEEKFRLYFCYSEADFKKFKIQDIAEYLEAHYSTTFNIKVMYYKKSKLPNEDILDYMERGIKWCNVFVSFYSPKSKESKDIDNEYKMAFYLDKNIISITNNFNLLPLSARVNYTILYNENLSILCDKIYEDLITIYDMQTFQK